MPRGYMESVATPSSHSSRTERLTEDQRRDLRQMRKRQRVEHRKRKILRLDEEGVRTPVISGGTKTYKRPLSIGGIKLRKSTLIRGDTKNFCRNSCR